MLQRTGLLAQALDTTTKLYDLVYFNIICNTCIIYLLMYQKVKTETLCVANLLTFRIAIIEADH